MMETFEVLGVDPQDEVVAEDGHRPNAVQTDAHTTPDIEAESALNLPVAPGDKGQKKRNGLTPEQKEKLQQIQQEQEIVRKERVSNLSRKLLQKISVWIETDRSIAVTDAFKKKMEVLETRNLGPDYTVRS
jgi:hypothetical protein